LELSVVAISICILAGRSVRAQTTPGIDAHVARLQTVGDERPVGDAAQIRLGDAAGLPKRLFRLSAQTTQLGRP
jgi:hypothetical protein